jgi:diacylglycerol kinase (ATP)
MASPSRHIVVAINPSASFGARSDEGPRVVSALEIAGHTVTPLRELDAASLRAAVRAELPQADALVVVGGDGMVSLGANIVAGTAVPLGIVPTGTGNDTARGLGIPIDDVQGAVRTLLSAIEAGPRVIDAILVHGDDRETWVVSAVSAGFDAVVNDRANRMRRPRGKSRYTIAIVRELATFSPIRYDLVVDGVARSERAMLISVANNGSIGGGMRIVPDSLLDDGELDLFIVGPMSRPRFLTVLPKVFSGSHTELEQVSISRVRTVRIDAPGITAYGDGERIGPLPIDVEVVPGALRVLA